MHGSVCSPTSLVAQHDNEPKSCSIIGVYCKKLVVPLNANRFELMSIFSCEFSNSHLNFRASGSVYTSHDSKRSSPFDAPMTVGLSVLQSGVTEIM